ncbi:MAG: ribonuclease J [Actinobacteria bacterium]|nr:ribonuclease J [Actinomycetota bacterium]MBU1494698.1 ribonuclease J [Actinomycetota bacterium]
MTVEITFLGGLGDVGRNCATLDIDGKIALIDCGLMFPEEDMLGVDLVLPDFTSVFARRRDVQCVVLTHGHEDHVGALPYFLSQLNVPVYGTALAVGLARGRIEEAGVTPDLRAVATGTWVDHGPFRFRLVPVSHSIPQGAGIAFDTPEGIIIHSGDFKLDPTPVDGIPTDLPDFADLGNRGVRLLMADSTNAERPGFVPSESSLRKPLYEIVVEAKGRLIAACFASHLHRVQQIVDAAVDAGRYVAFLGRSMQRNVPIAESLGLINIPADSVLPIEELLKLPPNKTAIISTGSQGEPLAALSLMANASHRWVTIEQGDTVLISARPIPGNETRVSRVVNGLLRRGAEVFHGNNAMVHVSGHGAREELKTFINVIRPQAFVGVHGEYRHLAAHAALARDMKVPEVFLCQDGDAIRLHNGKAEFRPQSVSARHVFVDGLEVDETGQGVVRDRKHLAEDGVVIVTVGLDLESGEVVQGPDLESYGFMDDPSEVFAAARAMVLAELKTVDRWPADPEHIQRKIVTGTRRAVKAAARRRTVVIPIIIEI